jgi:putative glutamine amidotransferase
VIGLTCYLEPAKWGAWEMPAALIPHWYLDLFRAGGAEVVLLPPGTAVDALDRLDGLAMAGGADIDAHRYGAEPHETADVPRTERDASELGLYLRARELGMPVLGICRGLQIMAVAHGGSLHQNVPDVPGTTVHRERPGHFVDHRASCVDGTLAASVFGTDPIVVNSSHHQAVDSTGSLLVSARAEDGTVEVCEDPTAAFVLGVQWHPEHPDRRDADLPLVRRFVEAAEGYRVSR